MKKILLLSVFLLFYFSNDCCGEENTTTEEIVADEVLEEQKGLIDYDGIEQTLVGEEIDFEGMVDSAAKGESLVTSEAFLDKLINTLFSSFFDNISSVLKILVICMIAAFFKVFADSFENKQIVEVGYYILFLMLISLSISSFSSLYQSAGTIIDYAIQFIEALLPSLMSLIALSGATVSSVIYSQGILGGIGIIENIIRSVLLPSLYILLLLVILNTLTDEDMFSNFINMLKKGYEWAIKILLWAFMAIFGLQSFGLPVIDGLISRTAKQTMNIVPVVGSSLSEISDIVLGCGAIIKNALGVSAIIAIVLLTIGPCAKILIVSILYKLCAALCEPITDERIVDCLSGIGDVCFLLLGTVLIVIFLIIASIAITLQLTNISLYIR